MIAFIKLYTNVLRRLSLFVALLLIPWQQTFGNEVISEEFRKLSWYFPIFPNHIMSYPLNGPNPLDLSVIDFNDGESGLRMVLECEDEISLFVPGLNDFRFKIIGTSYEGYVPKIVVLNINSSGLVEHPINIENAIITLQIPRNVLTPVDTEIGYVDILLETILADVEGNLILEIDLPDCKIAGTEIQLTAATNVILDLSAAENPWIINSDIAEKLKDAVPDIAEECKCLVVGSATITLPKEMLHTDNDLTIHTSDMAIGSGGLTGSFGLSSDAAQLALITEINGFTVDIDTVGISFVRGAMTECQIGGTITLPFFDQPIEMSAMVGSEGQFMIHAASDTGAVIVDNFLTIIAKSVTFGRDDAGKNFVDVDGTISCEQLGIDTFDFSGFQLFSDGSFSIPGGWINLPKFSSFSLKGFPFPFTLKKFNFGKGGDWNWLGLGGNFQFPDILPIGIDIHAIKIKWPDWKDISKLDFGDFKIDIPEIGINLTLQNILEVEGYIAKSDTAFVGEGTVKILPLKLELEGTFIAGRSGKLKYFYINIGTQFPSGIPLGATNMAIYGVNGGYGKNYIPSITEDAPRTVKWHAEEGQTFQAGTTFGTASDNGYTLNSDLTFTISIPGPVIMLQGDAWILQDRFEREDPNAQAIICWDNNKKSFLISLTGNYEIDNTIEVAGNFELLFSPENWHVYLGQKPYDKRIRAEVLDFLKANGYFMVGNDIPLTSSPPRTGEGVAMGAYNELNVDLWIAHLRSVMAGDLEWTWRPKHLYAMVMMEGELGIRVCGIGFNLVVGAGLEGCYPEPKYLLGDFFIRIGFPDPMDDFTARFELKFGGGNESIIPQIPFEHPVESVLIFNPKTEEIDTLWSSTTGPKYIRNVPLDAQFFVNFIRPIYGQSSLASSESAKDVRSDFNTTRVDTFLAPKENHHQFALYRFIDIYLQEGKFENIDEPVKEIEVVEMNINRATSYINLKEENLDDYPFIKNKHNIIINQIKGVQLKPDNRPQSKNKIYYQIPEPFDDDNVTSSTINENYTIDDFQDKINIDKISSEVLPDFRFKKSIISHVPKTTFKGDTIQHQGGWGVFGGLNEKGIWENERRRRIYSMHHVKWPSNTLILNDNNRPDKPIENSWQPQQPLDPDTLYQLVLMSVTIVDNQSQSEAIELNKKLIFSTGGPPSSLLPYIAWTSPQDEARPVYRTYDINIVFNEPYIFEMYPELTVKVTDQNDIKPELFKVDQIEASNDKITAIENLGKNGDMIQCILGKKIHFTKITNMMRKEKVKLAPNTKYFFQLLKAQDEDTLNSFSFITSKYANFKEMFEDVELNKSELETPDGGITEQLKLRTTEPIDWRRVDIYLRVKMGYETIKLNLTNKRVTGAEETDHIFYMPAYPLDADNYELLLEYSGLGNDIRLIVQKMREGENVEKNSRKIIELIEKTYPSMSDEDRGIFLNSLNDITTSDDFEDKMRELHENLALRDGKTLEVVKEDIAQLIDKYQEYLEPQTIDGNIVEEVVVTDISYLWNGH